MIQINNLTIATLGGHSALEICLGAKNQLFKTLVIAQIGREKTYTQYFSNLVDKTINVNKFAELTSKDIISKIKKENSIFIPHRYIQIYCDQKSLEQNFPIPIFGNKYLLKYEEREGKYTQYNIMDFGGIPYPKRISDPKKISTLCLVKVRESQRQYERSFFFTSSYKEFTENSQKLIQQKKIKSADLKTAVIEEFLIGAQVNFNFFYSPLTEKLELLGTDTRRQTNIDGLLRIPAKEQFFLPDAIHPSYIENGHVAVTVKESLLEIAFELAERVLKAAKRIAPPGIIGPFALQTAILPGPPTERIVVFDLSLRIPGSPGSVYTPYSMYHYGKPVSFGERIAIEIKKAAEFELLEKIVT